MKTINVQNSPSKTQEYNIRSVPTVVYVVDGKEVRRKVGVVSADTLRGMYRPPLF